MKKKLVLIIIVILCTGCMRIDNESNYDAIINDIINNNYINQNTASLGYTYYLPLGVSKVYDKDYNQKLQFDNTYMYLYVDAVSYYYKNVLNFQEKNEINNYYFRKIQKDDKIGYASITKDSDIYFIKIVYNYAKIETYVSESKISNALTNSMIILNSIDYNDKLIEKLLENEKVIDSEKEYKIDKPSNTESKFSEYLSEYVEDEKNTIPDLPEY